MGGHPSSIHLGRVALALAVPRSPYVITWLAAWVHNGECCVPSGLDRSRVSRHALSRLSSRTFGVSHSLKCVQTFFSLINTGLLSIDH
jgi:hypothetical protein